MKTFTIEEIADAIHPYMCEHIKWPATKAGEFDAFEKGRAEYMATRAREFEMEMAVARNLAATDYFSAMGRLFLEDLDDPVWMSKQL
jgi:hypothetical protein